MNSGKRDEIEDIYNLLDIIVNVEGLTNKWLMWSETFLPDQAVFVPSIFQLRDATSHFVTMFSKGLENDYFPKNLNSTSKCVDFFTNSETAYQLHEAFSHIKRAFYDCADYIVVSTDNAMDQIETAEGSYAFHRKMAAYRDEIAQVRQKKSESVDESYKTLEKWDSILSAISTIFISIEQETKIAVMLESANNQISLIRRKYDSELIERYDSDFPEMAQKLEYIPEQVEKYKLNAAMESEEIINDPQGWKIQQDNNMDHIMKELSALICNLDHLNAALKKASEDEKPHKIKRFFYSVLGWVSCTLGSAIITPFFAGEVSKQAWTKGMIEATPFYKYIIIFIGVFLGLAALGRGVYYIIKKR